MKILYEDNHIVIVNKDSSEIVQVDKTGDKSIEEKLKIWLKEKYHKSGNVFLGVPHRLDRPVSGVVMFAKTSKALVRLNKMFQEGEIHKVYLAITKNSPAESEGTLDQYIFRNEKQNKSYVCSVINKKARRAVLDYKVLACSDRYTLMEIVLKTGRHHQIRCQLANMGCPIKGDLKYGFPRSNVNGGISLHARKISFVHPVSKKNIEVVAPFPTEEPLWHVFEKIMTQK